ncbi:unnamed protein product [Closterium sp. NIES-54]
MGKSKEPLLPFTSSTISRDSSSTSINGSSSLPTSSSSSSLSSNPNVAIALLLVSRLRDAMRQAAAQQRPWLELVDRTAFARPDSLSDAASRIRKNNRYFHANYLVVLFLAIIISVLHNPRAVVQRAGEANNYVPSIRVNSLRPEPSWIGGHVGNGDWSGCNLRPRGVPSP